MVSHSYPAVVDGIDPPGPDRRSAGRLGTVVAAVVAGVVVAASGPLLGWLWASLAPRIPIIKVESGFIYAESEPEQAVAADGWFIILGAAAGVIFAVLAWMLLRRFRGVSILAGLALGSLVAAVIATWLGHKIGLDQFTAIRDAAAVGDRIEAPLGLRTTDLDPKQWYIPKVTGVVAVQALVAVFVYTCLSGFSSYADLRGPTPRPEAAWAYPPTPMPAQYPPAALPVQYAPPPYGPEQPTPTPPAYGPTSAYGPSSAYGPTSAYGPAYGPSSAYEPSSPPGVEPFMGRPPGPAAEQPNPVSPPAEQPGADPDRPDQLGPGWTGRSEGATGTART